MVDVQQLLDSIPPGIPYGDDPAYGATFLAMAN
ncbi:hypothetical protein CFII68_06664 [Pseudomonas sp. CFII68]|nr:hypothetical protein CFII68_06664 [Pseudomonas sp. CFII68]